MDRPVPWAALGFLIGLTSHKGPRRDPEGTESHDQESLGIEVAPGGPKVPCEP